MSDFERNEIKRENITAYILFCIIFAVGSFVFYKKTDNVYWAVALFVCSVILLGFYSRVLALEDEMATLSEEEEEDDEEEVYEEEEEEDDEEVRRSMFIRNLPAFKKEARAKYRETAKYLGRTSDNYLTDGIIDVWLVDGRIIAMLKWKQIENELEDFEGEYASMIVDGMSGRNVEFEYGLERYKNMSKYGSDGVKHSVKEEPEDDFEEEDEVCNDSHDDGPDPELAQILEELEANDDDDDYTIPSYSNKKDNNLIAQIFEKLMEK